ncbi:MAG: T9SS type A sorting domain-containing protein [Stygiobacter sp.]
MNLVKIFLMIMILNNLINAFPFRVNQIPNGNKFGCANCHVSHLGGGERNDFGKLVEQKYLDQNGNVTWNSAIANEDADGDGFTNGQELQDPNGTWVQGQPNPGLSANVFNPGDKNSKPTGTSNEKLEMIYTYRLNQNYPNPFNPNTQISYQLQEESAVTIKIYDLLGNELETLVNQIQTKGNYNFNFNANGFASGVYIYKLVAKPLKDEKRPFIEVKKMILSK